GPIHRREANLHAPILPSPPRRSRPCMPWSDAGASCGRGFPLESRQHAVEVPAGADPELGEHLVQVPLDGAGAEVELRADLGVRPALAGQPRDELLLGRELVARPRGALAHLRARGEQLVPGAFGERVDAHGDERVVGSLKLLARVDAPTRTTQPLAEEQPAARELGTEPGAPQAIDRLAVQALGRLTLAQQRARPRVEAQRPVGVARTRVLAQSLQTTRRELGVLRPAGGLDQLAERPHR